MSPEQLAEACMRAMDSRAEEACIVVNQPGAVGGTPHIGIASAYPGIDWDRGRLLIVPSKPVTALAPEDVAAIRESVAKGQSWHMYQQYKRWREEVDALKARIAELGAATTGGTDAA